MTNATLGVGVGWHHGLPMAEYLAMDALSASQLETFRRSPLHWKHEHDHPEPYDSTALAVGTATHLALLEPGDFERLVHQDVEGDGRTKAVREARAALRESLPDDAVVLRPQDYLDVVGMRDAVMAHPRASTFFRGVSEREVTGVWEDEATGLLCRMRSDLRLPRVPLVIDLKTTRDAAHWSFARDAARLGYHRKMAWYRRGERALGRDVTDCAIIAVESSAPYAVCVYLMREEDLDAADKEITALLDRFRWCQEEDTWPGYGDEFRVLHLPAYATQGGSDE